MPQRSLPEGREVFKLGRDWISSRTIQMTALLYRGHAYSVAASAPKTCVDLTYRREHYNTCREEVARDVHPTLTYRGVTYTK